MAQSARYRGRLVPQRQSHLCAGRLPALRRSALHACVPVDCDAPARRRHRYHRLRYLYRLRLLRCRLPLPGALQDHQGRLRLRRGSDAERDRTRDFRAPRRGAEMHVLLRPHRFRHREWVDAGLRSARDAGLRQCLHRRRLAFWRSRRRQQQRLPAAARAQEFPHACRTRHRAGLPLSLRQGCRAAGAGYPAAPCRRASRTGSHPWGRTVASEALGLESLRQFPVRRRRRRAVRLCGNRQPCWSADGWCPALSRSR